MEKLLWGRRLLLKELPKDFELPKSCQRFAAMVVGKQEVTCRRCGTIHTKKSAELGYSKENEKGISRLYYCSTCIQLGRVRSDESLYHVKQPESIDSDIKVELAWGGKLSSSQRKVSQEIVEAIDKHATHLVWAVTGAGKTEMLFSGIMHALSKGMKIGIASPRVDVCLELYPRLQKAFPKVDISLLYGNQEKPYQYTDFVICTTHQLLRFYRAFDLLIVDEVDSFPFRDNKVLEFAVKYSLKEVCTTVYLTATPTKKLHRQLVNKEVSYSLLPARYHGYPLPVPEMKWIWRWYECILNNKVPKTLLREIDKQILEKRLTLLFCPNIQIMLRLTHLLKKIYSQLIIECVYAEDSIREQKVANMRIKKYDLLLTTTILERGVTFSDIDVFVLGASHRVFTEASLVQIAGRVGRDFQFPKGRVLFFHDGLSRNIKYALKQIRNMNQKAKESGLLK